MRQPKLQNKNTTKQSTLGDTGSLNIILIVKYRDDIYMVARRYDIYLRVLKNIFQHEALMKYQDNDFLD